MLAYAVTKMPAGKILMGFSNYGYSWRLPWKQGDAAAIVSSAGAADLAASVGAEIRYDPVAAAPYFYYTDAAGQKRVVWFEDVRSAQAKFALLPEYGLLGLGYWNFMRPFTAGFSLQNYLFTASGLR